MMALRKCSQELHNWMGLALPAWDISYTDVYVTSANDMYTLNVSGLSQLRRCYAIINNDTTQYAQHCPVEIVDADELGTYQGNAAIAEAVAPMYQGGQWKVQFAPPVSQEYTYRIWYEQGTLPWYSRGDKPIPQIENYHYLLADLITVEVLPHCWWSRLLEGETGMPVEKQRALMASHRKELKDRSQEAIARSFPAFRESIAVLLASQEPFANAYYDVDFNEERYF